MIGKVWLVEPPAPDLHVFSFSSLPRLGLPILGAILKKQGYGVTILIPGSGAIAPGELAAGGLVGLSLTTSTAAAGYRLADRVRALAAQAGRTVPVVFGGVHPTFLPEEALGHGDFVIRREGEVSFPRLLAALDGRDDLRDIPGLSYRDGGEVRHNPDGPSIADLDALPFPDLTLIRNFIPRVSPVLASRGCPHGCTFCCVTAMMGRRYRHAGTERILAELRQLPTRNVFFYDDNFAADRPHARDLLHGIIRSGLAISWSAQVRSDVADDGELLALMRRAGCAELYIGFESCDQQALNEYGKGLAAADTGRRIAAIKRHGIHIHGMFILGADSDRPETVRETVEFASRAGIDTAQFMILTPLPGTPLFTRLEAEGRLLPAEWTRYDGANVVFRPRGMSALALQEITDWAFRRFYSWRLFCGHLRHRRWDKAGMVLYARNILRQWRNRHRGDRKKLRCLEDAGGRNPQPEPGV